MTSFTARASAGIPGEGEGKDENEELRQEREEEQNLLKAPVPVPAPRAQAGRKEKKAFITFPTPSSTCYSMKETTSSPPVGCRLSKFCLCVLDRVADCFSTVSESLPLPVCQQSQSERGSGEELMVMGHSRRRCLCQYIKPILRLSQCVGIVPLSLYHPTSTTRQNQNIDDDESSCRMVFRWNSVAVIVNTVLVLGFLGFLPFSFSEVKNRMSEVFVGTDLYTFSYQTTAMIFETTVLLLAGRFCRCRFTKAWSELNEVFHAMCDAAGDLKRIKAGSWIASLIIILEFLGFFIFNFWTFFSVKSVGFYQSCHALVIGSLTVTLTLGIPCIFSTLFLFVCLLIRSHFNKISEMLRSVLKKPDSPKLYTKIDALRVLHEQLVSAVSHFQDFFGIQILLTLSTGCFTVTTGLYACIVQGEGISSSKTQELTAAWWGTQMYCAAVFILFILISGQLVTSAAMSPAPVLNSLSFSELDDKSQAQVSAFLNKMSAFPTKISAMGITQVSVGFLASAATNIITYLLVLMQFKLTMENKSICENHNMMSPSGSFDGHSESATALSTFFNANVSRNASELDSY